MRKKEYLNEEEFQKNNQKVKTGGTIVMAIGICLVFAAILVLISASQMKASISESTNSNISGLFDVDSQESAFSWFENTTQSMKAKSEAISTQMGRQALGMFMLLPGIFITILGCMIRFVIGNQRNIMAYQAQQVMPIAQEGMEKMASSMGNVVKEIAPSMGNVAKEIAKGIKEGISDEDTAYCKHCGALIDADSNFCNKCGKQL